MPQEPTTSVPVAAGRWGRYFAHALAHAWLGMAVRRRLLRQDWGAAWPSARAFGRSALETFHVELEWLDRTGVDLSRGQFLLAANHRSWLDQMALIARYPRPIHVLSKKGYFEYPVLGASMRMTECIPVEEGSLGADQLERLMRYLQRGDDALFFVEGTRGAGLEMLPFRPGVFKCAAASGIPVLPVFILGSERLMSKQRTLLDVRPGRMGVLLEPPVRFTHRSLRPAMADFEARFRERFRTLQTGWDEGASLDELAAGPRPDRAAPEARTER